VTLRNGAFTVQSTGVAYSNFDGQIDLQPDRVHIDHIRLIDNHQQPMSISGDLAVHELEVGGVNLALKAQDFKVLDNKMGNVRIDSDLHLAGELRKPRLEGDLGVTTGVINLDPIVAQLGESAYATTPIEYLTEPAAAAKGQVAPPSVFEALQMDVHMTVPDDLVVKGSELGGPDAPIGFGAVNVTLGGDVRAQKNPGGGLRLVGVVNTVRGTYDFQGRRFDLLRDGTVRFTGLEELNPILDIRAQRVIQGVEAHVNVRGTLQKPEIELTRIPSLEQADILSLIVF